jgi:hypothetical protein
MVVNAGIGNKVTLATDFKVGSIRPDMSICRKYKTRYVHLPEELLS